MRKQNTMKTLTTEELDELSETPTTQADFDSSKLKLVKRNASGAVIQTKQRINIFLDAATVQYFKAKAGERGYQTLINETLKQSMQAESLEGVIRKTIRDELRKQHA